MHRAQQLQTVEVVVNEVKREKQEKFQNQPILSFFHSLPNHFLIANDKASVVYISVESAITDQVEEIEKVNHDAHAVVAVHIHAA